MDTHAIALLAVKVALSHKGHKTTLAEIAAYRAAYPGTPTPHDLLKRRAATRTAYRRAIAKICTLCHDSIGGV